MSGRPAPSKPWERGGAAGSASSPAEGLPKPWERPAGPSTQTITPASATTSALAAVTNGSTSTGVAAASQAPRPWERQGNTMTGAASTSYGAAGYGAGYGSGYGSYSMYNRPYGGSMYGSGGYGSSMYGGGMYGAGSMYSRPGMYGAGGMYGSGYGGMYGGGSMYGGGMHGPGPMGPYDPNDPPQPPSAWQAMLHAISGVVHFFGRLSFLVDENAHAVHFFISALLQLLDRFGSLYGELARFVLRLLGFKPKPKEQQQKQQGAQDAQQLPGAVPGRPAAGKPRGLPGMPAAGPGAAQAAAGSQWESLWSK